ncbi:MAG: NAD(+) diphosphatase [Jiangellales bacterium]
MPALVPPPYAISPAAFDQAGIDRMAEFRDDPQLMARLWAHERARVAVVHSGRALVSVNDLVLMPATDAPAGERMLLGVGAHGPVFVVHPSQPLDDDRARGIRSAAGRLTPEHLALFMHAVALTGWHERHPRCSACGALTAVHQAGYARRCPIDGSEHYPRTDPAVIVLVLDGGPVGDDRCLLGRQASWPEGRFSTLAGFVEPGETVEDAVAREVAEEVGVTVDAAAYAGSQPWPFPASLMLAYYAVAAPDPDGREDEVGVDGQEIVEARWFDRAEFAAATESGEVLVPPVLSVARRLIEGWFGGPVSGAGTWR